MPRGEGRQGENRRERRDDRTTTIDGEWFDLGQVTEVHRPEKRDKNGELLVKTRLGAWVAQLIGREGEPRRYWKKLTEDEALAWRLANAPDGLGDTDVSAKEI